MSSLNITDLEVADFFEMTPDLVCIAGKDGFLRKVNQAVITKLGYSREELFVRPIVSFIHPDDQQLTISRRAALLTGESLLNFENRYIAKSGSIVWLSWTSIYISDKEVVFAIAKDVTERKLIELEAEKKYEKYKSLASHFKTSIEEDRKYIALELHEEVAQLASVVKMDVDWVRTNVPELSAFSKERIEHASVISNLLIKAMQRISFSISPVMLEEFGLNTALNWHCKEFTVLNGIPCSFETAFDESELTIETKIDFFRICQEAMENIMYHAQASKVIISIEDTDGKICMRISDDGRGFDMPEQKPGFGLISMRERTASINGAFDIITGIGKGTSISIVIAKPEQL